MSLATEDHLDELIVMRAEGLRCLEVALDKDDKPALTAWQNCISRIEALITRREADFS